MKTILCAFLINCWQPTIQPQPTVLHNFLRDVANEQLSDIDLADRYMCPALSHRDDKAGSQARYIFHLTILEYKKDFKEQGIDPKNIVITPFDELAVKPVEILGDTKEVYEAQYKGKNIGYFLMQGNKIAALNLIHKSDKINFFLSYCE